MRNLVHITICGLCSLALLHAEPREWTNSADKKIMAEFVRLENGAVVMLMANGQQASVPLANLSSADQSWVKNNAAANGDGERLSWDKRRLPTTVQEPMLDMNIRVVKEAEGACVYESGNFQFKTTAKLGVVVMKDVCRAFESTHELVRRLPWGVLPKPEEGRTKFQAELYETRTEYLNSGAPSWSGGVYVRKDKAFRMPFEELGLSRAPGNKSSGYTRSGAINNDTITHEITHQMMHEYLPFAPVWLLEGTAEYTAHLPYRSGQFNVAGAVQAFKDMRESQRKPQKRGLFRSMPYSPTWIGVRELWGYINDITQRSTEADTTGEKGERQPKRSSAGSAPTLDPKDLANRYYSSHALVFYFMHLDGGGDAARMKKYFDALHDEKKKWAGFWPAVETYNKKVEELRPAFDAYRKAMGEFMKQPGVKDLGGGRFSYPQDLKPPVPPADPPVMPQPPDGTAPDQVALKHLGVLLDGRSTEQLESEVRAGFQKVGVSL